MHISISMNSFSWNKIPLFPELLHKLCTGNKKKAERSSFSLEKSKTGYF